MTPEMLFYWLAVVAVATMSAARITRLVTFDSLPPVKWLREKYADKTDGSGWQLLAYCGYCAGFWVALVVLLWALLAGVLDGPEPLGVSLGLGERVWWFVNLVMGVAYGAAIIMANDGDGSDEDGTA